MMNGNRENVEKNAVITPDQKILCPYCGKMNGVITGSEVVRNFKIRCRGSRKGKGLEHYFVLNVEREVKGDG